MFAGESVGEESWVKGHRQAVGLRPLPCLSRVGKNRDSEPDFSAITNLGIGKRIENERNLAVVITSMIGKGTVFEMHHPYGIYRLSGRFSNFRAGTLSRA